MDVDALQTRLNELHGRSADALDAVLAVHLAAETDARFNRFHNALFALQEQGALPATSIRSLAQTHFVREGLTAAVYHQRNVERIELDVIDICARSYPAGAAGLPPTTASFVARTLSYEYHAFLFALRAAFDYLARAVAAYFDESAKFTELPTTLKHAEPADVRKTVLRRVEQTWEDFRDVLGGKGATSARNLVAHEWPVEAGGFQLRWEAGRQPRLELVGGGEALEAGGTVDRPCLGPLLDDRVRRFEVLVFELLGELPDFAAAVDASVPARSGEQLAPHTEV